MNSSLHCFSFRLFVVLVTLSAAPFAFSEQITTAAVYGGTADNIVYRDGQSDLEDSGAMFGIYAQYIDTEQFQINDFVYYIPDVNDSFIVGNHMIFDYYLFSPSIGNTLIGAGYEYIHIQTDSSTVDRTENINLPYIRAGQYLNFGDRLRVSFLPWTGAGYMMSEGKGDLTLPMPPYSISLDSSDASFYWMNGINTKLVFNHFIDVKFSYSFYWDTENTEGYNNAGVTANIYFSRNFGVSYRFKYNETSAGKNRYNIIGAVLSF